MKLTFKQKKKIYQEYKNGYRPKHLAKKYNLTCSTIRYFCSLADKHGVKVFKHGWHSYSPEFKREAVERVLLHNESAWSVSIDLGLPGKSMLNVWIKSYIENGYNVVTKKKGRPSTRDKEKEDGRGTGEGERRTSRATVEEDYRERIIKKLQALAQEEEKKNKNN